MKTVTSKDGTKIAYDIYGSGPALIYITGASGFRNFMPVVADAKAFGKEFTVYSYDRRGRGDSGNTLPYSIEREVEDIEALIDAAGGNAYVYGHSSGAVLALEAALKLSSKVQKVLMYDPSYVHDEAEKKSYAELAVRVKSLLGQGKNKQAMKTFLRTIGMPGFFVAVLPLMPGWKTMAALAPTLAYDIELTKDFPPVVRASKVSIPTKIAVGQKTQGGIHEVAHRLVEAIPGATFTAIIGQDHMVSAKSLMPEMVKFFKGGTDAQ